MSEAVRLLWDGVAPGWDLVWIARPGIQEAEFSELQSTCARLLRRARLLKPQAKMPGNGERPDNTRSQAIVEQA
jgi:RNase P protein component